MDDYTPKEVAALLGCHVQTVYKLLKVGRLKGYRLGGHNGGWRIPKASVEALRKPKGG